MSNSNNKDVMRYAVLQTGYTEHPAGSNKTKFGKQFGMNGVPWCAEFVWASGENAKGSNPIAKSANAAGIQDLTVSQKGGSWVLKKTKSTKTKKTGLTKVKFGDIVSFDFGKNNGVRQHTGFAIGRDGDYYICIEGNTSSSNKGSQSNGGGVFIRRRKYTQVCSIARPRYSANPSYAPPKEYGGKIPALPKRGWFKKGDKGASVKALQTALNWSCDAGIGVDGEFGNETLFGVIWFQVCNGLVPDGEFGQKSLAKLNAIVKKNKGKGVKPQEKNKAEKIADMAKACAYPYGTEKSKYTYPKGKPKAEYKKALDKAYPDRSKWGKQTRAGASCDVFVGTVVRASGIDPKFPRGLDEVEAYLKKHTDKWSKLAITTRDKMKAGDIIWQTYKGGGGHTAIYLGGNRIADAHHSGKTYGIIETYDGKIHPKSKCNKFFVIRAK